MTKKPAPEPKDRSAQEHFLLDMLGPEIKAGVVGARERLGDETIMVRIGGTRENPAPGLCHVERGDPAEILDDGMTPEDAVAFLAALT